MLFCTAFTQRTQLSDFQQKELTKAIQLFDRKQFVEAEKLFARLHNERPDDFMVNYFYGACRTENGHYSDTELGFLIKASKEVSPLDIDYYFGVQYHAKGKWDKALLHYGIFSKTAERAEIKRVKLNEKMEQCRNHFNPYLTSYEVKEEPFSEIKPSILDTSKPNKTIVSEIQPNEIEDKDTVIEIGKANDDTIPEVADDQFYPEQEIEVSKEIVNNENNGNREEVTVFKEEQAKSIDRPVEFIVNTEITYARLSDFRTQEGRLFFEQAEKKQQELNSALELAKSLREKYSSTRNYEVKDSIGAKILNLESETYDLKRKVNQLFTESKLIENEYWDKATYEEKEHFLNRQPDPMQVENTPPEKTAPPLPVSISQIMVGKSTATNTGSTTTTVKDLSYKIQIGSFSKGIPSSKQKLFDKLSMIRKIDQYTDEKGVKIYTTGNLFTFKNAQIMVNQVQQEGVKDAFIAAFYKGKRISLDQAKEMEGIK